MAIGGIIQIPIQANFLHCIFGRLPFGSIDINSAWIDPTVINLANSIYEEWDLSAWPILGDALEESGCTDEPILNHCRQACQHTRGCWVVDSILGKKWIETSID